MTLENETLVKLEERVLRLIKKLEAATREIEDLKASGDEKDRQISELKEKVQKLSKEKGAVKDKVETLLGRIDGLI